MRILRIRRGFTTNSSGANEFLPTRPDGATSVPSSLGSGSASPTSSTVANTSSSGARTVSSAASSGESLDTFQAPTSSSSNGYALAMIGVAVVAAFAATPLVRYLRKRKGEPSQDDDR